MAPGLTWQSPQYGSNEDVEEGEGLRRCSPIPVLAFSKRQACCEIIKRYRNRWQHLLFWGGNYRRDPQYHEATVSSLQTLQDTYAKRQGGNMNPSWRGRAQREQEDKQEPKEQRMLIDALVDKRAQLKIIPAGKKVIVVEELKAIVNPMPLGPRIA